MMAVAGSLIALALPTIAAWALVGPAARGSGVVVAGRFAVAALLGLGLSSLVAFTWILAGGVLDGTYVAVDAAAFVVLGGGAALLGRRRGTLAGELPPADRGVLPVAAWIAVAGVLVVAAVAFARASTKVPHGEWDAWAIWNLRARFLLRAGAGWRTAFSPELGWSQLGYPLLLPLAVARTWAYAGESTFAPAAIAAVFTFAAPLALGSAVGRAAGAVAGATAAFLLLATVQLVERGVSQYADVAVAAYLVATLALLLDARHAEGAPRDRSVLLAGFLLGLAGWTKNEGIAAALCATVAHVALTWRGRVPRVRRDLAALALGAALPAAAWIVFHVAIERAIAPNFAMPEHGAGILAKLVDSARWRLVLSALWRWFPGGEHHVLAVAAALALVLGARPRELARSTPLVAASLLLLVDVLAYVLSPQDLRWHLEKSAERVLFQLWPALLLGLFAACSPSPRGQPGAPSP